jgi:hypothetical protein
MELGLHGRRLGRRVGGVECWLEPGAVRLAFDDEVVGGVSKSIDGALGEQDVVEHREPLGGVAIGGDDHRGASGALEEELVVLSYAAQTFASDAAVPRGAFWPHIVAIDVPESLP